uniref:Reverse transcriptase domain-containing protein n=1 Tax=Tanacetum cinerariifolium TaxID=118510 RepID=A0A6L2JIJ6_TANCI|nr:hypothetical protein [Tanacetum cinerariifolium]
MTYDTTISLYGFLFCLINVDRMDPKRTSTSVVPAMTQAAIGKLVADSVAATLETQAATMANTDNTNRNARQRETHVARKCSYQELMSYQPFNFKGKITVVILVRDRCPHGKGNLPRDQGHGIRCHGSVLDELEGPRRDQGEDVELFKAMKMYQGAFKQLRIVWFLSLSLYTSGGEEIKMKTEDITEILEFKTLRDRYKNNRMTDSTRVSVSLGKISLEGNKSWESNIGDSDNTGDGGKIAGREITTWGGGMVSCACMTSIFESSCEGEETSMSKRYLVKSFEELGEMLPGKAEK